MIIAIIIGIVVLLLVIGLFQKKEEQKNFREQTQINGGFRTAYPILTQMLQEDLKMDLVTDSGDNFFYQKDILYNGTLRGKFRVGRKIDYTRNNLLYTELINNQGEKKNGMPISFEGDVEKEKYKEFIKKSYDNIFNATCILTDLNISNYFLKPQMVKQVSSIDKPKVVKEYFCYYEDGQLIEELKTTNYYKDDKLIKKEEGDSGRMINSTEETEEFFYESGRIKFSHLQNSMFKKKNNYHYNVKGLLVKIETESQNKNSGYQTKFISKVITYNDNDLIIEEKHLSSNGETFYINSNTYDGYNNKIVEIIKDEYSFKKEENKFDTNNRVIEKVIYKKEKSSYPSETEHFEYDEENFIIRKTLKYSQYSFLTCMYHNSEWQIQKELSYNTENILTHTIDYKYENGKLIKEKRTNSDGHTTWTKYIYS